GRDRGCGRRLCRSGHRSRPLARTVLELQDRFSRLERVIVVGWSSANLAESGVALHCLATPGDRFRDVLVTDGLHHPQGVTVMVLGPRASASLFLPMRGQASFDADTPGHISSWERLARIRWKAAVREGSVYEREAHVVQVRRHIAQVDGFLKAT